MHVCAIWASLPNSEASAVRPTNHCFMHIPILHTNDIVWQCTCTSMQSDCWLHVVHAVSGTSPLQTPLAPSELRSACVLISISGTMGSVLIEGDIPLSE